MFVLCEMVDTVTVCPHEFAMDFQEALIASLNKKFANKVVLDVGLCICLYDLQKVSDSLILPGDGSSHTKVHFRFTVFRPFVDEIIMGKIKSCTPQGIFLTMGFFDDIFVPSSKLPNPSKFQEKDQVWLWEYQTEEDQPPAELFLEPGSQVRFRVVEEQFVDTQPQLNEECQTQESGPSTSGTDDTNAPYTIIVNGFFKRTRTRLLALVDIKL